MTIAPLTTDLNNIQALADQPNATSGLTPTQVKVAFDASGNAIKTYINNILIPDVIAEIAAQFFEVSGINRQTGINSNMSIAQGGISFTDPVLGTAYTLDGFNVLGDANAGTFPTIIHSQERLTSGDILGSAYYYRLNFNGSGSSLGNGSYYQIIKKIYGATKYLARAGKKVTVPFYARSSVTNKKVGVYLLQNYGTGGSPTTVETLNGSAISLTSGWERYSVTFDTNTLVGKTFGTNNDDYIAIVVMPQWGSTNGVLVGSTGIAETFVGGGTLDFAQMPLNTSDAALTYYPRSDEEELRACMEQYEKSYRYEDTPGSASVLGAVRNSVGTNTAGANYILYTVKFTVPKRISTPTIQIWDMAGNLGKITIMDAAATTTNNVTPTYPPNNISNNSFVIGHNAAGIAGIQFQYAVDAR